MADLNVTMSIPTDGLTITAPLPELVSQENVAAITGMPPARFLEAVRAPGFPLQVTKMGRLRFVDRSEFVAWIKSGAALQGAQTPEPANEVNREVALAARLGVTAPPKAKAR